MVINRLSVLVSGFGVGFSPVHTMFVVTSGRFMMFQGVSGPAVHGPDRARRWGAGRRGGGGQGREPGHRPRRQPERGGGGSWPRPSTADAETP